MLLSLLALLIACEPDPDCAGDTCPDTGSGEDSDDLSAPDSTTESASDSDDSAGDASDSQDSSDSSDSADTDDSSGVDDTDWLDANAPQDPADLRLTVEVWASPDGIAPAAPLIGAWLHAEVDLNGDGNIDVDERVERLTDARGAWTVDLRPTAGARTARLAAGAAGYTTHHQTTAIGAAAHARIRLLLHAAPAVPCVSGACVSADERVTLTGLPAGLTPSLAGFSALHDTKAFPGPFAESGGALLLSGGFAFVGVTNAAGEPVDALGADVGLSIALPPDAWSAVTDVIPDNGVIDTPLYRYDSPLGTWVADGTGVLIGPDDQPLPESAAANVRSWHFDGPLRVEGTIRRAATWNIDWPRDTITVVRGRLVDGAGAPIPSAVLQADGLSYIGGDVSGLTDSNGNFCVRALRSERAGESLDGNQRTGEPSNVRLSAMVGGALHHQDDWELPSTDDTCDGGGGLDLGDLPLGPPLPSEAPTPTLPACADLVEGATLLDRWTGLASPGGQTTLTSLPPARGALLGDAALSVYTREGFDFYTVWQAEPGDHLDLSAASELRFAVKALNPHPVDGWQLGGGAAWAELIDVAGRKLRVVNQTSPFDAVYPREGRTWRLAALPLQVPDAGWVPEAESGFNAAQVRSVRLHFDTWEYGFLVILDALGFADAAGEGLCLDALLVSPAE